MCDDVQLCNRCVREFLILARTWFTFGLSSKTGCDKPHEDVKVAGDYTTLLDVLSKSRRLPLPCASSGNSMIYNYSSFWFYGVKIFVLRQCSLPIILQCVGMEGHEEEHVDDDEDETIEPPSF
jgi:hypothetical protein